MAYNHLVGKCSSVIIVLLTFEIPEVAYPEDVIQPEQMPSDAASDAQPEAGIFIPAVIPQVDRTRKPIQNPKPEQDETPIKPVSKA